MLPPELASGVWDNKGTTREEGSLGGAVPRNIWAFLVSVLLTVIAGCAHTFGSPSVVGLLLGFTVDVLLRGGYESAHKHLLITRDAL